MSGRLPLRARWRIALGAIRQEARYGSVDLVAWTICRGRVRGGLFRGMRYRHGGPGMGVAPKLLGTYEAELIPVLAWAMRAGFDRIVNIGAAEGYYAVGLARAFPGAVVDAFECDPRRQRQLARTAADNGVGSRIRPHGLAESGSLRSVLTDTREPFLLVDIEGAEADLLDAAMVPELGKAWMLVELHPGARPDVVRTLAGRWAASHRLFRFDARPWRERRDGACGLVRFHWLAGLAPWRYERRMAPTPWLLLAPRTATRSLDERVTAAATELRTGAADPGERA
jgi:hypothetical protein